MDKFILIMGRSGSGKTTILNKVLSDVHVYIKKLPQITTRPKRAGEEDNADYIFVTDGHMQALWDKGLLYEKRTYETKQGSWTYATPKLTRGSSNYILTCAIEQYYNLKNVLSNEQIIPIFLDLCDYDLIRRSLDRVYYSGGTTEGYVEVCRRYIAESEEYKNIPTDVYHVANNWSIGVCAAKVREYILDKILED